MAIKKDTLLKQIQKLSLPLSCLKGIGPKRAEMLARKGLHTILDLLFFTPIRYEDRSRITPIKAAGDEEPVLVRGSILSAGEEKFFPSRKRIFKIRIQDQGSSLELIWFQYRKPYLMGLARSDRPLLAYGRISTNRGRRQMIHPDIMPLDKGYDPSYPEGLGFYPVYSLVKGMSANRVRTALETAMTLYLSDVIDFLPLEAARDLGLPDLADAVRSVHNPSPDAGIEQLNRFETPSHKRLVFDRFFLVMLAIAFRKQNRNKRSGPVLSPVSGLLDDLAAFFQFKLTPYQVKAIEEIAHDLTGHRSMNRLLLGDVGCGKTVVAAAAAYITVRSHRQVALMVPTQLLASQHLEFFSSLPKETGIRPVLFTGALSKSDREAASGKIENGGSNLVIGTQSLISEGLSFSRLGLVIIDEQHRFGVRERALIDRKGHNPHQLVMSATPIPRTLAMTVYGDLDISLIDGYPEGHRPVTTLLVTEDDKRLVFETVTSRMSAGQQVFVICPVIDGSEEGDLKNAVEMADRLEKAYGPAFRIGLIHGRLSPEERDRVMDGFRKGRIRLLVGTTVLEVGVHVPEATVMIIEHPERFGLAQLHQLRGRVGRGGHGGICFLMVSRDLPERVRTRLQVLVDHHDGFTVAEKDLEHRGWGELIGLRQAGVGELNLTEIVRNEDLLIRARETAQCLIESDPELTLPENAPLRSFVESALSAPLDL